MTQATNPLQALQRLLMTVVICMIFAGWGRAQTAPEPEKSNTAREEGNAVERYAREWEAKFSLKDYEPADELGKAMQAYFKNLFKALSEAMAEDPRDISRIVGEARERQADETRSIIDAFVAAGYRRAEAELYFDRLYPRLQLELARSFDREGAALPRSVKREDAEASDELIRKAEVLRFEKKDLVGALKALEDALRFAPSNMRVLLDLALQQQRFGRLQAARENFDLAREIYPKVVNIYVGMGDVRIAARDYYGAIEDLTTAIYLEPRAVRAYAIRGNAKLGLEDYEGAVDDFGMQIATRGNPGLETVYHRRAQAHFMLGNYEIARTDVEEAIRLEPNYAAAYRTLGNIHDTLGNFGAALAALNRAVELRPEFPEAYNSRLWVRFELGQDAAALADADRLVALGVDNAFFRLLRGALRDLLDQPEAAEKEYREAITLAQANRDTDAWYYANFHLDFLLRQQGRASEGYLDDVLSWPDDWPKRIALYLAGRITLESLINASRQSSSRRQQRIQECEANYYAGMLFWVTGRKDQAVVHLRTAADPLYTGNLEHSLARKILRKLATPPAG